MTVTQHAGGTTITGPHIPLFQMKAQLGALKLEMLGLKHSRGSVYAAIKRQYGLKGSKQRVYEQLEELIAQTAGELG